MRIRQATAEDLARVGPCANEFYASSRFLREFDLAKFVGVWSGLIDGGGAIFLLEHGEEIVGALGGVLYPDLYSAELIATEFFWFVREKYRGQGADLYRAFEQWGREHGCTQIRMVHLLDLMPERMAALYKRWGFVPAETHYVKEVQ